MTLSPELNQRADILAAARNRKMGRSANAYVRGDTVKFYERLGTNRSSGVPARFDIIC